MDEKFRKKQRAYQAKPNDATVAAEYIRSLEQKLGIEPEIKHKVQPTDTTMPCLMCEKQLTKASEGWTDSPEWTYIAELHSGEKYLGVESPWQGVHISTQGNYGSQVIDGDGTLHFYICDGCIIKHSHKMLYVECRSKDKLQTENGREMFEGWLKAIQEKPNHQDPEDSYLKSIRPYFGGP